METLEHHKGHNYLFHVLCERVKWLFFELLQNKSSPYQMFLKTLCGLVSWHTCPIFSLNFGLQEVSSVFGVLAKIKIVLNQGQDRWCFKLSPIWSIWQLLTLVDEVRDNIVVHSSVNIIRRSQKWTTEWETFQHKSI